MKKIDYISELTGTGKTGTILDTVSCSNECFLIAVPNKILCKEIYTRLSNRNINDGVKIINQDTHEKPSVALGFTLKKPRNCRIIITTHASFLMSIKDELLDNAKQWNLIIDEELLFYENHELNVSELSKDIVEKTVKVTDYDTTFYKISAKDRLLWNDIIIGKCEDSFLNLPGYVDMVKLATNKAYTTFIPKDHYQKFLTDNANIKKKQFKKFYAISICNHNFFDAFKKVSILCSFFEKTISYSLMKWMGLSLNKVELPDSYKHHPNSDLVTIHYYCSSNWSNVLKNKSVKEYNISLEEHIKEKIVLELSDKEFIYTANVGFRDRFKAPKGKLVVSTHGVNKYIDYTNMVFMPSLNATASLVHILKYFGLTRSEIDFARNVLNAYQFLSRGAIRKSDNKKEVNIYVMDQRTMLFLKTVLPNAKVVFHDAETLINLTSTKQKVNKNAIPPEVRSFVSRVRKKLEKGENLRSSTLKKFKDIMNQYY